MKNIYATTGRVKRSLDGPSAVLPDQRVEVTVREGRLIRALSITAALLVAVGLWSIYSVTYLPDFFARDLVWHLTYLNGETNLPALFSTLILLLAALILGVISAVKRQAHDRFARTWTGLALLATYLGVDEGASLHEKWTEPMADVFGGGGIFHYAWVIPYSVLVLAVLLACLRFLIHLPSNIRTGVILSGVIYVSGALGMELAEGWVNTHLGRENFLMEVLIAVEDGMEMTGVILIIATLLRYIRVYLPGLELRLGVGGAPEHHPS